MNIENFMTLFGSALALSVEERNEIAEYVVGYLRQEGWEVEVLDSQNDPRQGWVVNFPLHKTAFISRINDSIWPADKKILLYFGNHLIYYGHPSKNDTFLMSGILE